MAFTRFIKFNAPGSNNVNILEKSYREKGNMLLEMLRRARDEMLRKEGDISIYSSHDSHKSFANHLAAQISLIEQNDTVSSPDAVQ